MTTYDVTYNVSQTKNTKLAPGLLHRELLAVSVDVFGVVYVKGQPTFTVKFNEDPEDPETSPTILLAINNHTGTTQFLTEVQHDRYAEIDAKTREIIARGFTWPPGSEARFSLSYAAQLRMLASFVAATGGHLEFPVTWNGIDDDDVFVIPDVETLSQFCLYGIGVVLRDAVDSGSALKKAVRECETIQEALAVVDDRVVP